MCVNVLCHNKMSCLLHMLQIPKAVVKSLEYWSPSFPICVGDTPLLYLEVRSDLRVLIVQRKSQCCQTNASSRNRMLRKSISF